VNDELDITTLKNLYNTGQLNNPVSQLNFANTLKQHGLFNDALTVLQQMLVAYPDYLPIYNNLGTLYHGMRHFEEAIQYYNKAIEKQPAYIDAYYNLGLSLMKLQRSSEAIVIYQNLLKQDPDHFAARFQLGCSLMNNQQLPEAVQEFLIIEHNHPFHLETQANLATCYLKIGTLDKATTHYLKALDINPQDTEILFNLGVIQMKQGNIDNAIQYYQRVAHINQNHFPAHHNLGTAFLEKQHIAFALQHFQKALELQPHNTAIKHIIQLLNNNSSLLASPAEYITSLFDAYADHYESHLLTSLDYQVPVILFAAVKPYLTSEPMNILDLGCGTGLCGVPLKSFAKKLVGVDLSPNMLDVAKQKNIYNELITSDLLAYFAQTNSFDLIIAGDVLVYMGDLQPLFSKAQQALSSNGLLVFNTEITDEVSPGFTVTQSGRFIHHKNYIEELARQYHFEILSYQTAVTRQQNNEPVWGHVFVLQTF
jgi:predicted TPR repeat methyltransferase